MSKLCDCDYPNREGKLPKWEIAYLRQWMGGIEWYVGEIDNNNPPSRWAPDDNQFRRQRVTLLHRHLLEASVAQAVCLVVQGTRTLLEYFTNREWIREWEQKAYVTNQHLYWSDDYVTEFSIYLRACLLASVRYREYYWILVKREFLFFLLKSTGLYILEPMGKTFPKHHQLIDQKKVIGKIKGKTLHMGKQWGK